METVAVCVMGNKECLSIAVTVGWYKQRYMAC